MPPRTVRRHDLFRILADFRLNPGQILMVGPYEQFGYRLVSRSGPGGTPIRGAPGSAPA